MINFAKSATWKGFVKFGARMNTMRALKSLRVVLYLLPLLVAGESVGEVFKYRDAEGRIYLTDKPMRKGYQLLKRFSLDGGQRATSSTTHALARMQARRERLAPLIESVADEWRVRPALVHAVIRAESAYRADAVSRKGATGLMQLMAATAARFGVQDRRDPEQNLRGGTAYLRFLLEKFESDLELALAAYNAGESAVERYGNRVPPFPETRDYVRKVIRFYNRNLAERRVARR